MQNEALDADYSISVMIPPPDLSQIAVLALKKSYKRFPAKVSSQNVHTTAASTVPEALAGLLPYCYGSKKASHN